MQRWFPHHKLIDIVDEVDKLKRHCGYISLIDYLTMFDNNRQPTLEECLAKRSEIMLDALNHMSFDTFLDATMPECKFLSTLAANTERSTFISQMTNLNLQHKAEIFLDVKDRFNKAQNYMSSIDYSTMFNDDPQPTLENITAQTTKITLDALNRVSVDEFFGSVMCENINMLKNQCAKETSFPNLSSIQSSPKLCYLSVPRDHSCCFTSLYFLLVSSVDDYRFRSDPNYRFVCTQELRNIIAQVIEQNPSTYTDEILEKSRRDYCQWLRHPDMWGGDIELSICSNLYFVEICVINLHLQNPNEAIYRIGENDGHPTRIFLTYDGKHYNPTFTCINNEVHKRTRCDDIEIMTLAQNKQIEDYELSTLVISTEMESVTPQTMDLKTQLMVNNLTDFVNTLKEKCSYISPINYLTMFDNNRQPTSEELNAKYTEIMMDALHHMSCDTLVK
ncbi:unnamed protein product [Didymodactylos carnosus]|uniref:Ubiquitin thioesterase OTU n=1 Tax=Didymodactylos carnosus TaxID=1234261 RepID=A0A8S2EB36_9BILA|nr:unnamed protein product [Didymodactylos carnosus]CAF3987762.1 unnamed protein product [Didymodactylos carnosus]